MLGKCQSFHALINSTVVLYDNRPTKYAIGADIELAEVVPTSVGILTRPIANMYRAVPAAHSNLN
jgi:hypothetical protein